MLDGLGGETIKSDVEMHEFDCFLALKRVDEMVLVFDDDAWELLLSEMLTALVELAVAVAVAVESNDLDRYSMKSSSLFVSSSVAVLRAALVGSSWVDEPVLMWLAVVLNDKLLVHGWLLLLSVSDDVGAGVEYLIRFEMISLNMLAFSFVFALLFAFVFVFVDDFDGINFIWPLENIRFMPLRLKKLYLIFLAYFNMIKLNSQYLKLKII